jgi:hypothetical protein
MFRSTWIYFAFCLLFGCEAHSAEFACYRYYFDSEIENYELANKTQIDKDGQSTLCASGLLSGPLLKDDLVKFADWLNANPFTKDIKLRSSGGSIDVAMSIGRVIRSRFMGTNSEAHSIIDPNDPLKSEDCRKAGCCLSACVLVLVSGVSIDAGNVGLHRPSSRDFENAEYSQAKLALDRGLARMRSFLIEMEVTPQLYDAILAVPSDDLLLVGGDQAQKLITGQPCGLAIPCWYPRSVYEWSNATCKRDIWCFFEKIGTENMRLNKLRLGEPNISTPSKVDEQNSVCAKADEFNCRIFESYGSCIWQQANSSGQCVNKSR